MARLHAGDAPPRARRTARPFRTPAAWLVAPAAILGCCYLFISLPSETQLWFLVWNAIGLAVYLLYARRRAARRVAIPARVQTCVRQNGPKQPLTLSVAPSRVTIER